MRAVVCSPATTSCALGEQAAQALEGPRVGAYAEDHAGLVVALLEHVAAREDLAAQALAIVGHAKLLLDQVLAEEGDQKGAQAAHILGALGRQHERIGPA